VTIRLSLVAGVVASTSAGPDRPPPAAEEQPAPSEQSWSGPSRTPSQLPSDGVCPFDHPQRARPGEPEPGLPSDGAIPLEGPSPAHPSAPASPLPPDGANPLDDVEPTSAEPPRLAVPLGMGPAPARPEPLDPKATPLVRVDATIGSVWRIRQADPTFATSVEWGRMHGFSAAFHTEMIVVTDRDFVRALDFPVGVGAIARGRLRNRPLYGSVGLSAGILVHRAGRDEGVIRRVDPDFRVPIRLAWTVGRIGASLAIVAGYSVRERIYERRGAPVLERSAFRVGLVLGLHWDITVGRVVIRRRDR
jgi:hypothetical protein